MKKTIFNSSAGTKTKIYEIKKKYVDFRRILRNI